MNDEQKEKLQAILLDLAAEISEMTHYSVGDRWFKEISDAIRDL